MEVHGLSIQEHFANVADPRKSWNQDHRLSDILVMALCAIICGADSWFSVATFAEAKLPWFRRFPMVHRLTTPSRASSRHSTPSNSSAAFCPGCRPSTWQPMAKWRRSTAK
jgi:hypothetical protein